MKIPPQIKKNPNRKGRETLISIRITPDDKEFLDKNEISPTSLFNYVIELIKRDELK